MSEARSKSLVDALFGEVFQTERSAIRHCAIEADRLAGEPPSGPLRAVVAHAERAERDLRAFAERRGVQQSGLGAAVGALFSKLRDGMADFTLTSEQSYRGTLLGMRHGRDAIALFGLAAEAEGDRELGAWCARWVAERQSLVDACARALSWFADHPERALGNAKAK